MRQSVKLRSRRRLRAVFTITLAAGFATPASLVVRPAAAAPNGPQAAIAAAERLIATRPESIHRSPRDRFVRQRVIAGARGLQNVSYERTYAGLPVLGGDFVVVTDAAGRVLRTSMSQQQALSPPLQPKIAPEAAGRAARSQLSTTTGTTKPRLVVLARGGGRLAYETVVSGTRKKMPSRLHVLTDAETGATFAAGDEVVSEMPRRAAPGRAAQRGTPAHRGTPSLATPELGTAFTRYNGQVGITTTRSPTQYGMADESRPGLRCGGPNGRTFTGPDNVWGNGSGIDLETACADAMFAAQRQWDMLRDWLGRNGQDGLGRGFPMRVGLADANAFWDGRFNFTFFGINVPGDRQLTAIDVVAHEQGHAIFQFTPGGATVPDPEGFDKFALNESSGDIFGALTEWFANEPPGLDTPDYQVGEEVDILGNGTLIRSMSRPALLGDPDCWFPGIADIEPHAGAGPQNHWFYLLAEGSGPNDPAHGRPNSPTCNGRSVFGVGVRAAGMIYMETLNRKTAVWHYADARRASLGAALDLFPGLCGIYYAGVRAAWDAVGVAQVPGEPQPTEPNC